MLIFGLFLKRYLVAEILRFVIYQNFWLLFFQEKSNQKFKAAPASLRPVRERKAFFRDCRYRHLYNTTGVFDFNRRYRQS